MLGFLPVNALSFVTDLLDGRDIARLWFIGSFQLNRSLGSGGGVKSFRYSYDSLSSNTWPSLVAQFIQLEQFSTCEGLISGLPHKWTDWKPQYAVISQTVRRLHLCRSSDPPIFAELLQSGVSFPRLEELSIKTIVKPGILEPKDCPSKGALLSLLLKQCPSLVSLIIPDRSLSALSLWPPEISRLSVRIHSVKEIYTPVFPTGLEILELSTEKEMFRQLVQHGLPANLVKLRFYTRFESVPLSSNEAARLPHSIRHLELPWGEHPTSEELKSLPPSLTYLNLKLHRLIDEVHLLDALPRTLTRVTDLESPTIETIQHFPPNLTRIDEMQHLPEIYALLPPNLRKIKAMQGDRSVHEAPKVFPKLPASLTYLENFHPRYLEKHSLPPRIRTLKLSNLALTEANVKKLNSPELLSLTLFRSTFPPKGLFECIPAYLTELDITECNLFQMSAGDCNNLPKSLVRLKLGYVEFKTPSPFELFPQGLRELTVQAKSISEQSFNGSPDLFPKLERLSVLDLDIEEGLLHAILTHLPQGLKYFSYGRLGKKPGAPNITNESLESLPPGLEQLSCCAVNGLTRTRFSKLPSKIVNCVFGLQRLYPEPKPEVK